MKITLLITCLLISFINQSVADYAEGTRAFQNQNYLSAVKAFKNSEDDPNSLIMLGYMYENGYGVPQSYILARHYYVKANRQGDENAPVLLGLLYHYGNGVKQDDNTALSYFDNARFSDNQEVRNPSLTNKALIEELNGNYTQAYNDFYNAYTATSCYRLGEIYLQGTGGIEVNYQQAANNFDCAIKLGDYSDGLSGTAAVLSTLTLKQIQQLQAGTFEMKELNTAS